MTGVWVELGVICSPKQWKTVSSANLTSNGYPVYGANGVIGYYPEYNHKEQTLLVTCRGATCGSLNISQPYSYINGNAMALDDLSPSVLLRYLYYFLKWRGFSDVITGSAQPQIIRANLTKINIPILPLDEQARIVATLDAVAATLKKRQTQLAELNALAEARFVELFGGGGFPTVAVGDEFKTTSGGTPSSKTREYYEGGAIPWLNSGEVNRGIVDFAENFITELGLKNSSAKWIPVNSVLVAMYGATVGKVGLLRIPATTNQAVCSIFPNPQYCPLYLYFAVKSQEPWMRGQALGGAQPNISQTVIKKMTIPKPPLALQERFAAEVERVEALKVKVRDGIAETQTLFDALSQRYFS